jgi:hypothetical protein
VSPVGDLPIFADFGLDEIKLATTLVVDPGNRCTIWAGRCLVAEGARLESV